MSAPTEDKLSPPESTDLVDVRIMNGGSAAALFVSEGVTRFPNLKQIYLAIEKADISYGTDDKVIEAFVRKEVKGERVIFAKGKPSIPGEAARLVWHINSRPEIDPSENSDEEAAISNKLGIFCRVEKGEQILSKVPATKGEDGINVFGEATSDPVEDIILPQGENTYLSDDGLTLQAGKTGMVTWVGDGLSVLEVEHVAGSVDSQTGNLSVEGSVHVEKDVRSGFRVVASRR